METTEIIGYVAMICVAISLSLKNIKQLRYWNLAGALMFVFYGIIIDSWPVVILNAFLAVVNIYRLFFAKEKSTQA
ncbi:MAG: YgjV family protein [Flavobacteriales bacterium]